MKATSRTIRAIVVTGIALASLAGFTNVASASQVSKTNCTVQKVLFDGPNRLLIMCTDGTGFYAFSYQDGTNCPTQSLDTLKVWVSMAQSALLSGRALDFNYENSCGADKVIAGNMTLHL